MKKIYVLVLNPMRGNTENGDVVAISYDREKLVAWYKDQFAPESYVDEGLGSFPVHGSSHSWHKVFKAGGKLEWYNPINLFDKNSMEGIGYGHGINKNEATEEKVQSFIGANPQIEFVV